MLDEPFSSLDFRLREDMYALLGKIRSQLEPTIVLVTHDRREASVLADTIAVLDEGRILQHGPVAQVHYEPATRAVNRILGGLNEIPGTVTAGYHQSALGRIPVQQEAPDGPGLLVIRQEALRLVPAGGGPAQGTVTEVKSMGAHALVRVRMGSAGDDGDVGSDSIAVEVVGTPALRPGDQTGVGLHGTGGWVVPV